MAETVANAPCYGDRVLMGRGGGFATHFFGGKGGSVSHSNDRVTPAAVHWSEP
jgi:hypothetical protein